MSKLKFKTETIRRISDRDLDTFIQENTPFTKYCFCSDVEASNNSSVEINVVPFYKLTKYGKDELDEHWKDPKKSAYGEFNFKSCESILAKLFKEGKVDSGKYLVEVCW